MKISKIVSWLFDWVAMVAMFALVRSVTKEAWAPWAAGGIMMVFGWKQYFEGMFSRVRIEQGARIWGILKH